MPTVTLYFSNRELQGITNAANDAGDDLTQFIRAAVVKHLQLNEEGGEADAKAI